ncbi:hypothetical protein JQC92_16080 [Shewanella sp. 202IG2-18]|nr:hypothetical protein [Parashewanella hymeniacidonis]
MDDISRAWYGVHIELALLKKNEQEYEDFFCKVMKLKYSDNFQLIKAAGRDGDGKADGYLIPEKCVYQSYAPSSGFNKSKLLNKIEGDFKGAKEKWGNRLDKWVFLHNSQEGLPKYGLDLILELRDLNPTIEITPPWGPSEVKELILSLTDVQLFELFGPAPTQQDIVSLTHEPIKTLFRAMSGKVAKKIDIGPVSVDKLEFNKLSDDVEVLLTAGRRKEKLVEDLLLNWPDPEYGENLAESFRNKYKLLSLEMTSPDKVFAGLRSFSGGESDDISAQVSSLAVLSYFFERCDIFENAPEGWRV